MKEKKCKIFIPCETPGAFHFGKKNIGHIIEMPKVISYSIPRIFKNKCEVCGEVIKVTLSVETIEKGKEK